MPPRSARRAAKRKVGAVGFVGNATRRHRAFLRPRPGARHHAARADRLCRLDRCAPPRCSTRPFPDEPMTVLVDYFGREVTRRAGGLPALSRTSPPRAGWRCGSTRHGGRYIEGLDPARSYAVLERYAPRSDPRLSQRRRAALSGRHRRFGGGDLPHARRARSRRASTRSRSSPRRASARRSAASWRKPRRRSTWSAPAPSCPQIWTETYATADIVEYDGETRVKVGREFLQRGKQ